MLTNFDWIPMIMSKDTSPQKHIKIYIKICHKNVRMRELKIWKFSAFSVNVFKIFIGMLKNIENFWWKTEHFWDFQFRKIYRRRRGIESKKCAESKTSKVFSFPPKLFNIFCHTHKNFKNIIGKCRDFSDFR